MSEESAFLATIVAQPDEDTPRLAFADWLEEHGDPDRAEFIRLQIQETQVPYGTPESETISKRTNALYRQHGTQESPGIGSVVG